MSYEEFGKISRNLNVGDCCGREFWPDILLVYMNTRMSKEDLAKLYWKHTGLFESIVHAIKEHIQCVKLGDELGINCRYDGMCVAMWSPDGTIL